MKLQYIIIILSILLTLTLKAQTVEVNINDTASKNDVVTMPVLGKIENFPTNKAKFIFEVNSVQFELLDIVTNTQYATSNSTVNYSYDWQTHLISVECNNMPQNFDGILFDIKLRILPRMDFFKENEILQITPKQVSALDNNNETTYDLTSKTANIKIDTTNASQTFYESVSYNYPNPFNYETIVFFSVQEPTRLALHLYKPDGTLVQSSPNDNLSSDCLNYWIYNASNEEIITQEVNWNNYEFKKGLYKIVFRINRANIALGNYTLVLETNQNNYTMNIIYAN